MAKKKTTRVSQAAAKKKPEAVPPKLSEAEHDLVWHIEHGYALETDSLGGNPVLRNRDYLPFGGMEKAAVCSFFRVISLWPSLWS